MKLRYLVPLGLLAAAGCGDLLDTSPPDALPSDQAITSASGARTVMVGAYGALQSLSYYGGDYMFFNDLYADNAVHTGTFSTFADADARDLRADNGSIQGSWNAIYDAINRANLLIQKLPGVPDLSVTERDELLGQAYALRALHYHNLVRVFGGVPLRLEPIVRPDDAAEIDRSTVDQVYAQILTDLQAAEALAPASGTQSRITRAAVKAILARVHLYRGNNAAALAKADEIAALGFELAEDYSTLFDAEGTDTPEDIFKVTFTALQYQNFGYYYQSTDDGGRAEQTPEQSLIDLYDAADLRGQWNIRGTEEGEASGTKIPTTIGAEDIHVIRFAEVVLIRAEALARLNRLGEAVEAYNRVRERAGVELDVLGVDVTTQAQVLSRIWNERRLELAFEGDRFPDLVRTGQATTVLGIPAFRTLFPIPAAEIDVAPRITQNPGY